MKIVVDKPGFNKAIESYFNYKVDRNICVCDDDGKLMAGCGFTRVHNGSTTAIFLAVKSGWASKEYYGRLIKFPFEEMGAERCYSKAINKKAMNLNTHLGGKLQKDNFSFLYEKDACIKRAKEVFGVE